MKYTSIFRQFGSLLLAVCFALTLAVTTAAEDHPEGTVESRLNPKWLADAKQIRTPEYVIYYHGTATGNIAPDGKHWVGEIKGEILVLNTMAAFSSNTATACSYVRLSRKGGISVMGPAKSVNDSSRPWKKLLEPQN